MLSTTEMVNKINAAVDGANASIVKGEAGDEFVLVAAEKIKDVCFFAKRNPELDMTSLQVISGVDFLKKEATEDTPAQEERIEVNYMLTSFRKNQDLFLKVKLDRNNPQVESICDVWAAANFQERETYDMVGVTFLNHPDHRRILCPDDWEGFPLRKDYVVQEEWHGMKVNPEHKMNLPEREFEKRMKQMQENQPQS